MNTKFLLSPAYLVSVALMLSGAVLSGGRFMLIGWILCIVAARGTRRGFDDRPAVVQRLDEAPATDSADEGSAESVEEAAEEPVEAPAQKTN